MSELAKKKRISRKADGPASAGRGKAMKTKPLRPSKDQKGDSEAVARAVYDGMQDLRVKKPG